MLKRTIATVFVAALLCLIALPATALATEGGQSVYVGGVELTGSTDSPAYATTDDSGNVSTASASAESHNIKWDGQTLTLKDAYVTGQVNRGNIAGAAIGVENSNGAELTIQLEDSNAVSASVGIYVHSSGGDASLTITGSGSLNASGSYNPAIKVQSNGGNATLSIENAKVTATASSSGGGVLVQSKDDSSVSLTVDGGSLTATGSGTYGAGINFQFGTGTSGSGTPSLNVSNNAIVRASGNAGGIASNASAATPSGTGIVFDGGEGTVYGDVTLQENITINEGESLTIPDGASLNTGSHEVIVNGGTLTGGDKITGTVKYAPTITTESLPNGTVNKEYTQTLAATGSDTITWSVTSGSLPMGLSLDGSTGAITGTPTTEGTSTLTVKAENSYGSDSKEYTLTIDPKQEVSVTGVTLSATSLTLTEKETTTLTATVEPADATNQKVTWDSIDPDVVTVDANGEVTAVGAGTATITVTTEDGNKTATCAVTVEHDRAGAWSSDANGHWHACETCDDKLDHAAHAPKVKGAHDATCTEEGYTGDTVCSVCGYVIAKGESVPAAGHEYEDDGHCAVCDGIDPGFSPKIIAGADSTWQKGSAKNLTVTSNAAYEDFLEVRLDGTAVDQKHFHVAEGSTVVTLKASYLETLKLGNHDLEIVFATGTAKTTFAVTDGKANETIVPTGDSPLPLLGSVAAIALGVATILCGRALSREHQRL